MPEPAIRLVAVGAADISAAFAGTLDGLTASPGWPHEDSAVGLSFATTGGRAWLVTDGDGRIVGECGTKAPPDAEGRVEIGYGLAPQARGRGLGTCAVATLTDLLAAEPEVTAVVAHVLPDNVPSRRVLEHAGFAVVGMSDGHVRYERHQGPG